MKQSLQSLLIFAAGIVVAVGAEQLAEHRLAAKAARQADAGSTDDEAPPPAPKAKKKKKRGSKVAKVDPISDDKVPEDAAEPIADLAPNEAEPVKESKPVPVKKQAPVAEAPATPAPTVTVKGTLRSGELWTDASFATANLDVPVEMKGLRGLAGSDRWWPIVYTAPASDPTKRVTFFGEQHKTPQTIHMNFGQLGLRPTGAIGSVTIDLRATALLTDSAGKVVTGKAGQAPLDRLTVKLHSLRSLGTEPVTLLLPAQRTKAQTGAWFTVPGQINESSAAVALTLARGDDLGKLASLLRRVPDFAVVPAAGAAGQGLTMIGRGHVVATVTKGDLPASDLALVAGAVGATLAFHGSASTYVADLTASADDISARVRNVNLGETVYVYGAGNGSRPFLPVKAQFLSGSGEALNMIKQNGTALFTQPVEIVALPAH